MAPTPNPARRPVRTRTRPSAQPPAEPDLRGLFGLDRLSEADADALLCVQALDLTERRFGYHQALGGWLHMWRRLDDHRQYIARHGFVSIVTRHDDIQRWSWSVARELQPGAQPGPALASCRRYSTATAAKLAAYDFVADLSAGQRAAGDLP